MIKYVPIERVRNEDTVQRLREMVGVTGPLDPSKRVENAANVIVEAMTEIHGGEWRSKIDHHAGYVMIVPY